MFEFINVLKALATILITNSHYGNIWPVSAMAMGGLLGNVIFFAVSGFCLYNIKLPFHKWYAKRIIRIYPPLWIVTMIAVVVGYMRVTDIMGAVRLFIYPTFYHFIASIMLLYICYYILIWFHKKCNVQVTYLFFVVSSLHILVYVFWFDKSYYHIDVVEEPMIRFLYLEAMLIGVWFRNEMEEIERLKRTNMTDIILLGVTTIAYFGSKLIFSRMEALSSCQILNQVILLGLLFYLFKVMCSWEFNKKFKSGDYKIGKIIRGLAEITIEIYLVQYLVYYVIPPMAFPINFVVVTVAILLGAIVLNKVNKFVVKISSF